MTERCMFVLVVLCFVGAFTQAASLPGLTMGDFIFTPTFYFSGLYDYRVTDDVGTDGFSLQKARLNLSLTGKSGVPFQIYYRADLENSAAMTREAYGEITVAGIQITAGMLKSPLISLTPASDLLETVYSPGLARLQFADELGLKVGSQAGELLWQVGIVNGNGVQWKDDDRQKDVLAMLGWCPKWGTLRAYYSHAVGPGGLPREIVGGQALATFSTGLMVRGSYLYRTDFLPDQPDTPQRAWYVLAVQKVSRHFELPAQYDWIDDASVETGRWTYGADWLLSDQIKVKANGWHNVDGPKEDGAAVALCLRFY